MPQLSSPKSRNAPTIHQSLARSCWRIPSSTAYLARSDGASAKAVACGCLDRVGELPLEQSVLVDVVVDRARVEQLVVGAARGDAALVEDDDLVGERDRREAVGDDQGRPVAHRLAEADADPGLR